MTPAVLCRTRVRGRPRTRSGGWINSPAGGRWRLLGAAWKAEHTCRLFLSCHAPWRQQNNFARIKHLLVRSEGTTIPPVATAHPVATPGRLLVLARRHLVAGWLLRQGSGFRFAGHSLVLRSAYNNGHGLHQGDAFVHDNIRIPFSYTSSEYRNRRIPPLFRGGAVCTHNNQVLAAHHCFYSSVPLLYLVACNNALDTPNTLTHAK